MPLPFLMEAEMIEFEMLHPRMTEAHLGLLPNMLSVNDPRSAKDQLDTGYAHGGGWKPFHGFTKDAMNGLSYPGDPPMRPLAQATLRDERIVFYRHSWIAVIQKNGTFEVCRMD